MHIKKLIRLKHRLPLSGDNDASIKIYALPPYETYARIVVDGGGSS
jgi:hypothetical protein